MSKKILDTETAVNLNELIRMLKEFRDHPVNEYLTYVTINSDSVRLNLVEETLSDGSKVYNVELSAVTYE